MLAVLEMKSLVTKRDKGQSEKIELPRENIDDRQEKNPASICLQNALYQTCTSNFENKSEAGLYFPVYCRCFRGK